jgi:hypothetical protein
MMHKPLAYFLTFTTYGTWLHGDERKSIVVKNGIARPIKPNAHFQLYQREHLQSPPVKFDAHQRKVVLNTLLRHCELKSWQLFAAHVRTTHVHMVVQSDKAPEQATADLKAWCTRHLRQSGYPLPNVWTRHESTIYIFTYTKLIEKIRYVVYEQGKPMNVYIDPEFAQKITQ